MAIKRVAKMADAVPNYPGRAGAEALVRILAGPLIKRHSTSLVLRLLGYWVLWDAVQAEGEANPRAIIVDRGYCGRAWSYETESDFVEVFGCTVADFRAKFIDGDGHMRLDVDR